MLRAAQHEADTQQAQYEIEFKKADDNRAKFWITVIVGGTILTF